MSECQHAEKRVPGISDRGVRRYRIFNFDFDTRPRQLLEMPNETWNEEAKKQWKIQRDRLIAGLGLEFGSLDLDRKVEDFADFGAKPFSIVAHHNTMFDHVRTAFVSGAYYAAITGACALGERILNHLMLDLRENFSSASNYKDIYRKKSFDRWSIAIDALEKWQVLLPDVVGAFQELEQLRNRSIHFNPETSLQLRADALLASRLLNKIIERQFCAFGIQPWFIEGTLGAGFIKKEWESNPFVAHYYCAKNLCVGPFHSVHFDSVQGWRFVDHPDYGEFGVDTLTDEQFKDLFNKRDPAVVARIDNESKSI